MLKKRILASSMASVMALSAVSVVAFADETTTSDIKTEVVTLAQLKEFIKEQEEFAKKELDKYGDIQSGRLNDAIDHAKGVADDSNAESDEFTAAYQMLKAVKSSLQIYTADELQELIDSSKSKYDTNNVLNEDLQDTRWTEESWDEFEDAYDDADRYVDSGDGRIICDAYCRLDDAISGLKDSGYVTKSEFRAVYNEFENIINSSKKYQDWRRGVCTVNPTTGKAKQDGVSVDLTLTRFVSFEDLKTIVYGDSNIKYDTSGKTIVLDNGNDLDAETTWINTNGEASVEAFVKKAYDDLTTKAKATNKTSDSDIKNAYKAAKEAIAVFNGWEVDEYDTGNVRDIKKLNEANTAMVIKKGWANTWLGALNTAIKTDASTSGSDAILDIDTANGKVTVNDKIKEDGYELCIDKDGYLLQDDTDGHYVTKDAYEALSDEQKAALDFKKYTLIKKGNDITKYIPINQYTAKDENDDLVDALKLVDKYAAEERLDKDDRDFKAHCSDNIVDGKDMVDLDTWNGIAKYEGSAAEYAILFRNLQYVYDDYNASYKDRYSLDDVIALIAKSDELIEKTADAAALADVNTALVTARKIAKEFVSYAKANGAYKANKPIKYTSDYENAFGASDWVCSAGDGVYSTNVYVKLKKYYDECAKKLKDYPVSYGEVLELIAEVSDGLDAEIYGSSASSIKTLVADIAYRISVLDATGEINEPFDEDRAAVVYNRVFIGDGSSDAEKTLNDKYNALNAAVEAATAEPEKPEIVMGDIDGVPGITPADATAALDLFLNDEYIEAADMNHDGFITPADAYLILEAWLEA